jgi:hypothetical protein
LGRPRAIPLPSLWQVCLKRNKICEDDLSTKTVPRDDNDKNQLLIALNIRITEVYVKQKGGIKTESLEIRE